MERTTVARRANAARRHSRHAAISARRGVFASTTLPRNIHSLRQALTGISRGGIGNFVINENPYSKASVNRLASIITALEGSPAYRNNRVGMGLARSVYQRLYRQLQLQAARLNSEANNLQRQMASLEQRIATVRERRPPVPTRAQQAASLRGVQNMVARLARGVTPLGGRPRPATTRRMRQLISRGRR
jgi:hypothetical protein